MTVLRSFVVLATLAALLLGAGCGGNGSTLTGDETNDALYQQAQDLEKQGRNAEALNAYLKEIDRRGESGAPESHLQAGALYLNWSHNPFEAYHHFSKYLELQPTGPRASMVRGQREAAMREMLRFLKVPSDAQGVALDHNDEVEQLKRQIEELKAENQTLRGASSTPVVRPPMIALPEENAAAAVAASDETLVTPVQSPPPATADSPFARGFGGSSRNTAPGSAAGGAAARAPVVNAPPRSNSPAERVVTTPTRPGTPQRPTASSSTSAHRTHTVAPGEKSLWGIARQYYGSVNQARVSAIYDANRDVMRSPNDLRAGMVLRIP